MEYTEHPTGDGFKWVRFYIEHLPFEVHVKEEENGAVVVAERLIALENDYAVWGDYLHSDLAFYVEYKEEENGN